MKAVVILNGEPLKNFQLDGDEFIISADGALNFCDNHGIKPNIILGDFDSLGRVPDGALIYPTDKDLTDGELALECAIEKGADEIVFACAGGLREDHFMGNLNLLLIAHKNGIKASLLTNYSKIYYVTDRFTAKTEIGSYVSVLAVEDAIIKTAKGLKFEYKPLNRASTLGISNVATSENISLELDSGSVFVFVNHKNIK